MKTSRSRGQASAVATSPSRMPAKNEKPRKAGVSAAVSASTNPLRRLAVTAGCMTIFMLRIRDVVLNPQFWSEDGKICFRDNLCEGAGAIGKVYAGYIHLVPRLTALLSGAFPP